LRSAKDLGRVLALAWLSGRDDTERWLPAWREGLQKCFLDNWRDLAARVGTGLRDLLDQPTALTEARITTEVGLLNGKTVTVEMLAVAGERLIIDVITPLTTPDSR
jgi:hypothetical protein